VGAIAVAVATGPPGREALAAADPDFLLNSLEAWPDVSAEIGLEDHPVETPARRA
jgi:hypothetical protein